MKKAREFIPERLRLNKKDKYKKDVAACLQIYECCFQSNYIINSQIVQNTPSNFSIVAYCQPTSELDIPNW